MPKFHSQPTFPRFLFAFLSSKLQLNCSMFTSRCWRFLYINIWSGYNSNLSEAKNSIAQKVYLSFLYCRVSILVSFRSIFPHSTVLDFAAPKRKLPQYTRSSPIYNNHSKRSNNNRKNYCRKRGKFSYHAKRIHSLEEIYDA